MQSKKENIALSKMGVNVCYPSLKGCTRFKPS